MHRIFGLGECRPALLLNVGGLRKVLAVFVVFGLGALLSPFTFAATFTVTSLNNGGPSTLRQAINAANNSFGSDTITFGVSGTISLISELPALSDTTGEIVILGGGAITLDGSNLDGQESGLTIFSRNNIIDGLTIVNFPGHGIMISGFGAVANRIQRCRIGTDGTTAQGNDLHGVAIFDGAGNRVGNKRNIDGNVISGNGNAGVYVSGPTATSNIIRGNFIGTDETGTLPVGNGGSGIEMNAALCFIGGRLAGQGNVVGGNRFSGIALVGSLADDNRVEGNFLGTDPTGTVALGNGMFGVLVGGASRKNDIGGTLSGAGNLIANNSSDGIRVEDGRSARNTIRMNSIHDNSGQGIKLTPGANGQVRSPIFAFITLEETGEEVLQGFAFPGTVIDVYLDSEDEGAQFLTTFAAGAGEFLLSFTSTQFDPKNITMNLTDENGNSSGFATAVSQGELPTLGVGVELWRASLAIALALVGACMLRRSRVLLKR